MADAAAPAPSSPPAPRSFADVGAIAACSLIWGSTWFAITLQLGSVDPQVSIAYRFGLAAALFALLVRARGESLTLTRDQHVAAIGMGVFLFTLNYTLVYLAEQRIASAVVAVVFASLAFTNLIVFRIAAGERAPRMAWTAAALGVLGVGALLWEELRTADFDARAAVGGALALGAVLFSAIANVFAARGQRHGARVLPLTGWAMGYGAVILAVLATVRGAAWTFEPTFAYVGSLLYLSVFGSVIAFALYYALAKRRGYALASYISALTPPIALGISSVFEGKAWTPLALVGVATVITGQIMLMRTQR
ncbi:MAG: EamA family transporter [Maricaulaceae bacterium]|jgi:drug/metabolite transporter (DMT)-like permease